MKQFLNIHKIYTTIEGEAFPHVLLDDKQGVELPNGSYETSTNNDGLVIDKAAFAKIKATCILGEESLEKNTPKDTAEAYNHFAKAIKEIPDPFDSWHASAWVLSRMGECLFRLKRMQDANDLYQDLMWFSGALGNPWIHLRKGQTDYELGDLDRASDELMRAYMGGGKEIFALEGEKYFAFLKNIATHID